MNREQSPQEQLKQPEAEASDKDEDPEIRRKGKKPSKKAPVQPSSESTPSPAKRALLEAAQDKLRTETGYRGKKAKLLELVALLEVQEAHLLLCR